MTLPSKRLVNFAGFLVCAGLMGFALFAEHVLYLDPCPLCVFQRVAVILLGIVFLVAALHDPRGFGRFVYAGLLGLIALGGMGVAAWHVRMQGLPPEEVPTCGPGLSYILENNAFGDALAIVFTGSGSCADVVWEFLGLSMPAWVFLWLLALGAGGAWNNVRRPAAADAR